MKKNVSVLVLAMFVAGGVFAQGAPHKHSAGDMLLGLNWSFLGLMMNTNPIDAVSTVVDSLTFDADYGIDAPTLTAWATINTSIVLPTFFATARILTLGVSYEYYIFHWLSVGTGLGLGPEVNLVTKGEKMGINKTMTYTYGQDPDAALDDAIAAVTEDAIDEALKVVHMQAGLFLTIPFNVHFNIPKVEWLYGGLGIELHIPLSDLGLDNILGSGITKYLPGGSIKGKTFVSMPIDVGFDFSLIKMNGKSWGNRMFFRVEPEFFGEGLISLPISLVWQSNLWKVANAAIPGTK
jgi:hypothetical protein